MNIQRDKAAVEETPKVKVGELEPGTVFKIGKKLFLRTDGGSFGDVQAVRLTTGSTEDDVTSESLADNVIDGTFTYA